MGRSRISALCSVAVVALALGCGDDPAAPPPSQPGVATFDAEVPRAWYGLILQITKQTPGYSPPVASREFGYLGVGLYEALVPGMTGYHSLAGQLNALDPLPAPEVGSQYHWPTVANSVLATLVRHLYPTASPANQAAVEALEAQYATRFEAAVAADVFTRSVARGQSVAHAIYAWSVNDAGHEGYLRNFPTDYVAPSGPGLWVPTPRLSGAPPQSALQPYWGNCRPFVLPRGDPNRDCEPGPPPTYSEATDSPFYAEALEVYTAVNSASDEQRAIALFWADNPGSTATPPGHSISILTQVLGEQQATLALAAEAYAKVGIAVADAFIACWEAKYRYNLLRPVTYIRAHIQADWLPPLLDTPPFPEYTSGHSVQSGAAFRVLTQLFGANYAFVDHTHDAAGLAPRSFASFDAAAEEAALSRLYGGIHFRAAIERGITQGRCIGDRVNALQFHETAAVDRIAAK